MKIKVSEKEILKSYLLKKYDVSKSGDNIFIYKLHLSDQLAQVNIRNLEIRVYDKDLYEPLLKFGNKNNYETLVKCWDGANEKSI